MTHQQTFDIVARHLIRQGVQSANSTDRCVYRGIGGRKCAAGCLIPDSEYSQDIEGLRVLNPDTGYVTPAGRIVSKAGHDLKLVYCLQEIHDEFGSFGWAAQLWHLAKRWNLSPLTIYDFR